MQSIIIAVRPFGTASSIAPDSGSNAEQGFAAPGATLSVPMLAIAKIICDRVRPLAAFGHFLEG
jgi:hypothetical protein